MGFAGLLLNWPLVSGLGVCDLAWLPGFNADLCSWGIWFVYAGLILCIYTTTVYVLRGIDAMNQVKAERAAAKAQAAKAE